MKGKVKEMMRVKQYCNKERRYERKIEREREEKGVSVTYTPLHSPILNFLKDVNLQELYL